MIGMSTAQGVENIKGYDDTDQEGPREGDAIQHEIFDPYIVPCWSIFSIDPYSSIYPLYSQYTV